MRQRKILEVCVASCADAISAEQAGADRLELNVALELGGLTPSAGLVLKVLQHVSVPVIVMIRPRGAGFCYFPDEQHVMLRDAEMLLGCGAAGIASAALHDDGRLDRNFWRSLVELAGDRETIFHRAFDVARQPERLLAELIECGTTRILTSGGQRTAAEGASQIARLRELAANAIEILPGSGITPENVAQLLHTTGCDQVHGSLSHAVRDPAGVVAADHYPATCGERVAAMRSALDAT